MSYLTLPEAVEYVAQRTGHQIQPSDLLRAGVLGVLVICAPFGFGPMYNATKHKYEDFRAGFLVIPPAHLLEIETEGRAKIQAAIGLNKPNNMYFPYQERTRDQLRVLVTHLEEFMKGLVNIESPQQTNEAITSATALTRLNETACSTSVGDAALVTTTSIPANVDKHVASASASSTPLKMAGNSWDEFNLRRLYDEYSSGRTQVTLAEKYGVSRQRIGTLLKKARGSFSHKRAGAFDTLFGNKRKT